MKRSNRLIILVGIFLAVVGGLGTVVVLSSNSSNSTSNNGGGSASPSPTAEPVTTVVIAKKDINLGDKITADMVGVESMTISQQKALGTATFSDVGQVIGRIAGGKITSGQILVASRDFLSPGSMADGQDIAGAVGTGMLGVSMEVDQVNGVGTLLVPGDHVDIILSIWMDQIALTAKDSTGTTIDLKGGTHVTTKMVIQNRKILATLLAPPEPAANAAAPGSSSGPAPTPTQALVQNNGRHMIIILEVTPADAEVLRWAQREEKQDPQTYIDLSVALRSDKDNDLPAATTPGITFKMLVDKYGVLPPDPRGILPADLARGISW